MLFFEQQQTNQQNLKFNNTAFLYFVIAISIGAALLMMAIIMRHILNWKKMNQFGNLSHNPAFAIKIKLTKSLNKNKLFTRALISKIIILFFLLALILLCQNEVSANKQLIGFDPYSILQIGLKSNQTQIKKSYRKLALQHHPDRNNHTKASIQKFILITKAFQCLTNQQVKYNCIQFGNPQGEYKEELGIGLPQILLQPSISCYVVLSLYFILIAIITLIFSKSSKTKKKRKNPKIPQTNTKLLSKLMTPKLNTLGCCLICGSISELDGSFSDNNVFDQQEKEKFVELISQQCSLTNNQIQTIKLQQLYRAYFIFQYMQKQNTDLNLAQIFPELCIKILKLAQNYAKLPKNYRSSGGHKIHWYGLIPLKQIIKFSRTMFNRFDNINEQQNNVLSDQPSLKLMANVFIDQTEVTEISTTDTALLKVKIIKSNTNNKTNYCLCQNYPLIIQEHYILLISQNCNLLHTKIFTFLPNQHQYKYQFKLSKLPQKQIIFQIHVSSLCYALDEEIKLNFEIFPKFHKNKIVIHEEDRRIQSIQKNFFQKILHFSENHNSDSELSDSDENDNPEQNNFEKQSQTKQTQDKHPLHEPPITSQLPIQ